MRIPVLRQALALLLLAVVVLCNPAFAQFQFSSTSVGRDFIVGFGRNAGGPDPRLAITVSSLVGANVQITTQAGVVLHSFTVAALTAETRDVDLALYQADTSGNLLHNGLRVTASADVSVYALNRAQYTTDATVVYPVPSLGKEYTGNTYVVNAGRPDCLQIMAAYDNTVVTLNLTVPSRIDNMVVPAGLQTFVLHNALDNRAICNSASGSEITGSIVTADKDVAVFAFTPCSNVPTGTSYCDMLLEQLVKTTSLGLDAVVVPLLTRSGGDIVRVVASFDNTKVLVNGVQVTTLNKGKFYETSRPSAAATYLQTDKPAYFAQYCKGATSDGAVADPFLTSLPSSQFWLADYIVSTVPGFSNYMSLVTKTAQTGTVSINGGAPPVAWSPVGGTSFSYTRFRVPGDSLLGAYYRVRSSNGTPVGVQVYGFATDDSYGYNGGGGFVDVAPDPGTLPGGGTLGEAETCPNCATVFTVSSSVSDVSRSTSGKCLRLTFN